MANNLRILVVDDDRMMVQTLVDTFRMKGYESEGAFSAEDAIEKVKNSDFDFVISDINGVDLFRRIREERKDMPVVVMTAYSGDDLVKEGLDAGARGRGPARYRNGMDMQPESRTVLYRFLHGR